MDVLTSETCWALNNGIIKQVTSSWSLYIQLYVGTFKLSRMWGEWFQLHTTSSLIFDVRTDIGHRHLHDISSELFLRRFSYKSWIISLIAVCALRSGDTVSPPTTQRADGPLHKNGSFMRTRLRSSLTSTPQNLRHRILFTNGSSQRRLFPVPWKHQPKTGARCFSF